MHTSTNIFISNLAVSDILMGGVILPQMLHDTSHVDSDFDEGRNMFASTNFKLPNSVETPCSEFFFSESDQM